MERQKLTIIIPAGNVEDHLEECISTARFADEVMVVVDTNSTDATLEIANRLADTVLVHPYENYAAQNGWALPQAKHPWVFVLDADERCTPTLEREILQVLENNGPADGYKMGRENHFAGQKITGCGWQRDEILRLFRRDRTRYRAKKVHAGVEPADDLPYKVGKLRGKIIHYTFEDFSQYLYKHGRYARWAGHDRALVTKSRVGYTQLALRPAWRFFRQFILYGGWRDGIVGFIICWMAAHSVFLKYVYVWEKQQGARLKRDRPNKNRGEK